MKIEQEISNIGATKANLLRGKGRNVTGLRNSKLDNSGTALFLSALPFV